MPNDPTTQTKKWADSLLLNEHLKLIKKLFKGAFDISFKAKQTAIYFHCIKVLLKIDSVLVISQLLSLDDVNVKLITYLRDTQKEKICTDAIYIFESVFSKRNECKELFTQDFIMSLFELIDLIEDDLNFESAVKVLMLSEHNNFVKVYHNHRNARVFNEILIRLNNILDNEKDNILYTTDIESLIDIIIIKLQIAESKLISIEKRKILNCKQC